MGEAKRRRERGDAPKTGIRIPPRKRAAGFLVVLCARKEFERDGMIYAQSTFQVVTPDGMTVVEETPDGPAPVLLVSVPQPIRRALLAVVR